MNFSICTYSHTDYSDVWPILFGQLNYYTDSLLINKYLIINKEHSEVDPNHKQIFYDDTLIYRKRLIQGLKQIPEDYILYQHEDMILYDEPSWKRLNEYVNILNDTEFDFVKLIKGGEERDLPSKEKDLKIIPSDSNWIFAIQPSIWKRKRLIEFLTNCSGKTIWEIESRDQNVCRNLNIRGYYNYSGSEQLGRHHWRPEIYPYIATAIVKGKWNFKEYKKELKKLFLKYEYNPIRGHN